MTAFTTGTPKNALIAKGEVSTMNFTPSAATLAAGGTAWWWSGHAIESATAGLGIFRAQIDIDGLLAVTPGQIAFVCGSIAQTGLFTMSLAWCETDID